MNARSQADMPEVSRVLAAIESNEPGAAAQLLPLVYDALRDLAAAQLAREGASHTLEATALVHEAYLRLVGPDARYNGRGHFFGAAAEAMRRILIEKARRRRRLRHGGGMQRVGLGAADAVPTPSPSTADDLLALDEALTGLTDLEPQAAAVVKLRYFAGLTIEQAADALEISVRTANRHWAFARAWLYRQLHPDEGR